jgi:hypothetical protein
MESGNRRSIPQHTRNPCCLLLRTFTWRLLHISRWLSQSHWPHGTEGEGATSGGSTGQVLAPSPHAGVLMATTEFRQYCCCYKVRSTYLHNIRDADASPHGDNQRTETQQPGQLSSGERPLNKLPPQQEHSTNQRNHKANACGSRTPK